MLCRLADAIQSLLAGLLARPAPPISPTSAAFASHHSPTPPPPRPCPQTAASRAREFIKQGGEPRCLMDFWAQKCLAEIEEAEAQGLPPPNHTTIHRMVRSGRPGQPGVESQQGAALLAGLHRRCRGNLREVAQPAALLPIHPRPPLPRRRTP